VCAELVAAGHEVVFAGRAPSAATTPPGVARVVRVGDIGADTPWATALDCCELVVHLAGRAHQLRERAADPLAAFRAVNTAGTAALARQAASAGVRRLVFVSTIGVHGDTSREGPLTEGSALAPHSPYAVSKLEAETALRDEAARSGLEVVVVRPPLVYGPGAPGNVGLLLRVLERGVPLPLAGVRNQRTLVDRRGLARLLALALVHPAAAGQTFVAGDAADVSTPEMIRALAAGLGRPARLFALPPSALGTLSRLAGRGATWRQLAGTLRVSSAHAQRVLGWEPTTDVLGALADVGRHWRERAR
jgi:nucleoside-diphosphate-sugar epimerase